MALQLGDVVPDFSAETTMGRISLHKWIGDSWAVLFSHPADFTPVCTTELAAASRRMAAFQKRNVKMIALSVDPLQAHKSWLGDIEETQGQAVTFPVIADPDRTISNLYGMIHPNTSDTFTVRSVFVIDPNKKLRLSFTYPPSTGRNFDEILRVIDSLQLTDAYKVATPADWTDGGECVIVPALTDPKEMQRRFPKGWTELKPYLRMTPQPNR